MIYDAAQVRTLLPVAVLAGLGCSDPVCDLDELLERDLDGMEAVDCGDHGDSASENELYRALACVLDAVDAGLPFRVTWEEVGFESRVASAYVGTVSDSGSLQLWRYTHTLGGLGDGFTGRSTCDALGDFPECDRSWLRNNLCLECVGYDPTTICEGE